jgi:transposase
MWKSEHRRAADRSSLRYPSDLTDAEWAIVQPLILPAKHGGRRRSVNIREALNGRFVRCYRSIGLGRAGGSDATR